jgi:hypothetical protein
MHPLPRLRAGIFQRCISVTQTAIDGALLSTVAHCLNAAFLSKGGNGPACDGGIRATHFQALNRLGHHAGITQLPLLTTCALPGSSNEPRDQTPSRTLNKSIVCSGPWCLHTICEASNALALTCSDVVPRREMLREVDLQHATELVNSTRRRSGPGKALLARPRASTRTAHACLKPCFRKTITRRPAQTVEG